MITTRPVELRVYPPLVQALLHDYPNLIETAPSICLAFEVMEACFRAGGKLLVCGNGGSAADSDHVVGELMKGFLRARPLPEDFRRKLAENFPASGEYLGRHLQGALPAISLVSHAALLTAYGNDVAADMAFAQQVYGYGRAGDILLGISTSGKSANVLNALRVARALGLGTLGLAGRNTSAMQDLCDVIISVPGGSTPRIQEMHLPVYHTLCALLEESFFAK